MSRHRRPERTFSKGHAAGALAVAAVVTVLASLIIILLLTELEVI